MIQAHLTSTEKLAAATYLLVNRAPEFSGIYGAPGWEGWLARFGSAKAAEGVTAVQAEDSVLTSMISIFFSSGLLSDGGGEEGFETFVNTMSENLTGVVQGDQSKADLKAAHDARYLDSLAGRPESDFSASELATMRAEIRTGIAIQFLRDTLTSSEVSENRTAFGIRYETAQYALGVQKQENIELSIPLLRDVLDGLDMPQAENAVAIDQLNRSSGALVTGGVEGFIEGALVYADNDGDGKFTPDPNKNGKHDAGEDAVASTDHYGNYTLTSARGPLRIASGTGNDPATNTAFTGGFSAPAGSAVLSAWTTLLQTAIEMNMDPAEANTKIVAAFGLPAGTDLTRTLPMDNPNSTSVLSHEKIVSFASHARLENLISTGIEMINGAGSATSERARKEVLASILDQINTQATGKLDLSDQAVVGAILGKSASALLGTTSADVQRVASFIEIAE